MTKAFLEWDLSLILTELNIYNYNCVKTLSEQFNSLAINFPQSERFASDQSITFILDPTRLLVIDDARIYCNYKPWSSEMYGELSGELVFKLKEFLNVTCDMSDTFLDLGCGIGNVVLQMSAYKRLGKCISIEIRNESTRPKSYLMQGRRGSPEFNYFFWNLYKINIYLFFRTNCHELSKSAKFWKLWAMPKYTRISCLYELMPTLQVSAFSDNLNLSIIKIHFFVSFLSISFTYSQLISILVLFSFSLDLLARYFLTLQFFIIQKKICL